MASAARNKDRAAKRAVDEKENIKGEVVAAIKCLLLTWSNPVPLPPEAVFQLNYDVLIIARNLMNISVTEPHEVLGIFERAVTEASKQGVSVPAQDLVKILGIMFDPALKVVREEDDAEFIESMFAQDRAIKPFIHLLDGPQSPNE